MPLYDYRCTDCGKVTEVLHRMSETHTGSCECGGSLQRIITYAPHLDQKAVPTRTGKDSL